MDEMEILPRDGAPAKAPFSFRGERRGSGVSAPRLLKKVGASDT